MSKQFYAYIETCADTGLLVGTVPALPGARAQAENLDQLAINLKEVVEMVLEELEQAGETTACGAPAGFLLIQV